jgi:hypothetical protein
MAVTLPPEFNFPGVQQGIPQGVFQIVQGMAQQPGGIGGGGLSQSIAQLMQPTAPITGPQPGATTLPPMPKIPGPKVSVDPKVTPSTETSKPFDFSTLSGAQFRALQTGKTFAGAPTDLSKMPVAPTGKQLKEIQKMVRQR